MKKSIFNPKSLFAAILAFSVILVSSSFVAKKASKPVDDLEGTINISGAFALYPIAVKWAAEFKKLHPNVVLNVNAGGAGKGIADVLGGLVDIGLASRDITPAEFKKGGYEIFVTKDAVVPVVNASNPNIQQILTRGIKRSEFSNLFVSGTIKNWKQLPGLKTSVPIHVYTRSDASGAGETWAKYFGKKQEDLTGVGVFGDPGVMQAVKRDVTGIGYNNISYLYDSKTRKQAAGLRAIPIDLNSNGKIDADENFYDTIDQLTDAIVAGKYPAPPARTLGFLFKGKPNKKVLVAFVKFVLTDGQKYVDGSGYIALSKDKLQLELKKLN